jgi:hypothetical protein
MVPVPMTRSGGSPEASRTTCVSTSTGLLTTMIRPRWPRKVSPMLRAVAALSRRRSSRVSSARPPRPAATTTAAQSRISSRRAARTLAAG